MLERSDAQLLRDFAKHGDEAAFREVVIRYTDFVYSAALRQVASPAAAADVAQSVFIVLARKAGGLVRDRESSVAPGLAGWLHQTTRYAALNHLRETRRREHNERQAMEQFIAGAESEPGWEIIRPVLDEALECLGAEDREAVLLRYFKNQDFRAVGEALGISDDAAQKRVSRAVERLREYFAKRKVAVGAGSLAVLMAANAVQAAPAGLATAISGATLTGATVAASTTAAITKTIVMTILQKTVIALTVAALAGAGLYEARQAAQLREQIRMLQQQQSAQTEQMQQWRLAQAAASNRLVERRPAGARSMPDSNLLELVTLRGELAALKSAAHDPTEANMQALAAKVKSLKELLDQRPQMKIPELAFLTDKTWAQVAWDADLSTEDGVRLAFSNLRGEAVNVFLNEMMKKAMKKYLAANGNVLPADLSQLTPYFEVPVTDEMLSHYQLLQAGTPDKKADLVKLTAHVDDDYDSNHGMSINGAWGGGYNRVHDAIYQAIAAYAGANLFEAPAEPAQITPYLKRNVDPAALQKYFAEITADMANNPPTAEKMTLMPLIQAYESANAGQHPKKPSDLLPYATTSEQQVAIEKVTKDNP